MARVCRIGLPAEFMTQVVKPSLQIKRTGRVYWCSFRVQFRDPFYSSILPVSLLV